MTSILLSYARDDDEAFVRRLHADLTKAGFDVWFDRVSMPSRQLTFHQEIRDAIAAHDRLLLVVGPGILRSDYVAQEWRFAYFEANKCVNPIVRLDGRRADGSSVDGYALIPEDLRLLHAEDFRDDAVYEQHLQNLVRQLSEAIPPVGKLVAVPELPAHFRVQPDRIKALRDLLLVDLQKPVVVSGVAARVGLQGMGGIGKSVLASALAHRPEVRRAFADGIFWITLGQKPQLAELQRSLARELGDEALFPDERSGKECLRKLLAGRKALLVLDDVWQREHAEAFNVIGAMGRILLTTRDAGLVTALASKETHYRVELPSEAEAETIFAAAAHLKPTELPAAAKEIVSQCGRLPLALALCGGMVQGGVLPGDVLEALREHDLEFLSSDHPAEEQHRNVWKAMDVSLRVLPLEQRDRFAELAVFALDRGAPETAVVTLWEHTGGLSPRHARKLLADFAARSLVQLSAKADEVGQAGARMTLHDLLHNFATGMAEKLFGSRAALHHVLLDAYEKKCPEAWPSGPDDGYFFSNLVYHLISGASSKNAVALVLDFRWLKTKIGASKVYSLQQDFALLLQDSTIKLDDATRYALEQLRNVIGSLRFRERLPTVIWGHFANSEHLQVRQLLQQALDLTSEPWLRPITPSMASPNPALMQAISFPDKGAMLESLAIGDTVIGHPIIAAITEGSPKLLLVWIDGTEMPAVNIPAVMYPSLSESLSMRATNLPVDCRPALLVSWTDSSHGSCCSLWDLSRAPYDIADYLAENLNCLKVEDFLKVDHQHPLALGPAMLLGMAKPISLARIAGRLVLLSYESAQVPWLVDEDGKEPNIAAMDEHAEFEWRYLVLQKVGCNPEKNYIARLHRLAELLSKSVKKKITVSPSRIRWARAVVHDVETGELVPRISWSLTARLRPVLIGEDQAGCPFLIHTSGEDVPNLSYRRLGAKSSIRLAHGHWLGEELVLSRRDGRPVLVKGGILGIEVVDATSCEVVGRFMKHLDNERLLSAGIGEDGSELVASVGDLGTRGRFSTSVRIWDVETLTQISPTGELHTGKICVVASGRYRGKPVFATGGSDLICIWSTRPVPGYSVETESKEISDPNICGRVSASRLPTGGYRHHDLGAIRPLLGPEELSHDHDAVVTWASRRSTIESLIATQQVWKLQPLEPGEFRRGVLSSEEGSALLLAPDAVAPKKSGSPRVDSNTSEVVSVTVLGKDAYATTIETIRRDGTRRVWGFSRHADWERQRGTWHYWYCVSIQGAVLSGTPVAVDVNTHTLRGEVAVRYKHGENWKLLNYDPGCPATQCALGEDGSLVIFDERGTIHYLELVIPSFPAADKGQRF